MIWCFFSKSQSRLHVTMATSSSIWQLNAKAGLTIPGGNDFSMGITHPINHDNTWNMLKFSGPPIFQPKLERRQIYQSSPHYCIWFQHLENKWNQRTIRNELYDLHKGNDSKVCWHLLYSSCMSRPTSVDSLSDLLNSYPLYHTWVVAVYVIPNIFVNQPIIPKIRERTPPTSYNKRFLIPGHAKYRSPGIPKGQHS